MWLCLRWWFFPIVNPHLRVDTRGKRDFQHIVHAEAEPAKDTLEVVLHGPPFRQGMDEF